MTLIRLKTQLRKAETAWVDKLLSVLWAHQTTVRSTTHETPFSSAYRVEIIVPTEVLVASPQMTAYVAEANDQER